MDKLLTDHEIRYIISCGHSSSQNQYYIVPKGRAIKITTFRSNHPDFAISPDEMKSARQSTARTTTTAAVWKLYKDEPKT